MTHAPLRAHHPRPWIASILALAFLAAGCEATPGSPGTVPQFKAKTTIQHDAAPPGQAAPAAGDAPLPAGHPAVGAGDELDSKALLAKVEAMKESLKDKPKTLEVVVALGSLYYDNGKYLDGIDYYRQAIELGRPFVDYDLQLRKEIGKVEPARLTEAGCDRAQLHDSEPMLARAKSLHAEKKDAFALACADEAMRPVVMAHTRRGNAFYLIGNASSAVAEHEKAVALDPTAAESLFFKGAILFDAMGDDIPKLKEAKDSWTRFLEVAPDSPRAASVKEMMPQLEQAIALGGVSKLPKLAQPPGHPTQARDEAEGEDQEAEAEEPAPARGPIAGPLDPGAAEAVRTADIDAETIASMGHLLDQATEAIAKGDMTSAVTSLKSVFPFTMAQPDKFPDTFRARAGALMSLYMASKGAPMAAPLLNQAVGSAPEAVDGVADGLAKAGDTAHAKQLWSAIRSGNPAYAAKAKLDDKLAR